MTLNTVLVKYLSYLVLMQWKDYLLRGIHLYKSLVNITQEYNDSLSDSCMRVCVSWLEFWAVARGASYLPTIMSEPAHLSACESILKQWNLSLH